MTGIISIPESGWEANKPVEIKLPVRHLTSGEADLSFQVALDPEFPWENVWLNYILIDPAGDTLKQSTDNLFLFEPGIGRPLGRGNSARMYVNAIFLQKMPLKAKGDYRLILRQQMRTDTLKGIQSIGVRISEAG